MEQFKLLNYITSFILIVALLMQSLDAFLLHSPSNQSALNLILLHNNDMHAHFEQSNKHHSPCRPDEIMRNKCYGGFARVSETVKKFRKEADAGGPSVLYLNAGDTYTGTPWFGIFKADIATQFLNILKPDAAVRTLLYPSIASSYINTD